MGGDSGEADGVAAERAGSIDCGRVTGGGGGTNRGGIAAAAEIGTVARAPGGGGGIRFGGGGGGKTRFGASAALLTMAGFPGKLIRAVSRPALAVSPAGPTRGGKVIRTVSFLGPFKSLMKQQKVPGKTAGNGSICHSLT